ncbi:GIY-YIG nuclease family protein [Notoacmeibacter ruber]|uniref:GIY-YIG nuclease family protein n=1 Tax=Notoacmeibacter ruber TaxID=2670375 RepID=A0A3L7JFW5_9HYPH|nr:GIY-YIG nuclease family protein [Notoacmeibacter ruber]
MASGRQVRLYLVDGSASGVVTAEIINWTGIVIAAPRDRLTDVLSREDARKTGVYFLFGDVTQIGAMRDVYVGEADDVGRRISQHAKDDGKDFFERFCIIVSKDFNLTKAHSRYLERRLAEIARNAGRSNVLNANEPPAGRLPEADISDMEFFIEQIKIILPVLGFDTLRPALSQSHSQAAELRAPSGIALYLRRGRMGMEAEAIQLDGETVVLAGSKAKLDPSYASDQYSELRKALIGNGTLCESEGWLVFKKNHAFSSPSAASAVIYGRSDNGRNSWIVKATGQTLKEYETSSAEMRADT